MIITEKNIGIEAKLGSFLFFFGNRNSSLIQLEQNYPQLQFSHIAQIHSDICLPASMQAPWSEADAHWSPAANRALCIKTADCIPVLIVDLKKGHIASVHAGWKGVAKKIVPQTIEELLKNGADLSQLITVIGPHIQFESFEVKEDVLHSLLDSIDKGILRSLDLTTYFRQISEEKYLVDLNSILKKQLQELALQADQVFDLHYDTKTNLDFHSYRRDQAQSGRQISFVARLGSKI